MGGETDQRSVEGVQPVVEENQQLQFTVSVVACRTQTYKTDRWRRGIQTHPSPVVYSVPELNDGVEEGERVKGGDTSDLGREVHDGREDQVQPVCLSLQPWTTFHLRRVLGEGQGERVLMLPENSGIEECDR